MAPKFNKEMAFTYGVADQLSPLVRRVVANNPSAYTFHGTNSYLVGEPDGEVALIDPGPDLVGHVEALERAMDGQELTAIIVTHRHIDHTPAAKILQDRSGAPIFAFEEQAGASFGEDSSFHYDIGLKDKEVVRGNGWTLRGLHTPGHCGDHLCFALEEENLCLVGDHVMAWASSIIIPPEGRLEDYFTSLDYICDLNLDALFPGHGPVVEDPATFLPALKAHRLGRNDQIIRALKSGRSTKSQLVALVYAATPKALHAAAAYTLEAHLIYLQEQKAIALDDGHYRLC